jgi:hypothetical protein
LNVILRIKVSLNKKMIKTKSDDPDLEKAATEAGRIVAKILKELPKARTFDYGGHNLKLGDYDICTRCTSSIAEAQHAYRALKEHAESLEDELVAEHVLLAADLLRVEAEAAEIRAKLHNGNDSERILNHVLGFIYDRKISDDYDHSHHKGR